MIRLRGSETEGPGGGLADVGPSVALALPANPAPRAPGPADYNFSAVQVGYVRIRICSGSLRDASLC